MKIIIPSHGICGNPALEFNGFENYAMHVMRQTKNETGT